MSSIDLKEHIICLRPEADFIEFDAVAPARFSVEYLKPDDFLTRILDRNRSINVEDSSNLFELSGKFIPLTPSEAFFKTKNTFKLLFSPVGPGAKSCFSDLG